MVDKILKKTWQKKQNTNDKQRVFVCVCACPSSSSRVHTMATNLTPTC